MLPTTDLLPSDLTQIGTGLNAPAPLSPDAIAPGGKFAELLELRLQTVSALGSDSGQGLPQGGDELPRGSPAETGQALATLARDAVRVDIDDTAVDSTVLALAPLPVQAQAKPPELQAVAVDTALLKPAAGDPRAQLSPSSGTLHGASVIQSSVAELPGKKSDLPAIKPETIAQPTASAPAEVSETDGLTSKNLPSLVAPTTPQAETVVQRVSEVAIQDNFPQINQLTAKLQQPTTGSTSIPASTSAVELNTPVQDAKWGERVAERVLFLADNKLHNAEIRLTPAELGPLRVSIAVQEGATNVTFHAQHALTREALEQALPRLREMLTENGLTLGQASVAEQDIGQGHRDSDLNAEHEAVAVLENPIADTAADAADEPLSLQLRAARPEGLLDTFV